MISKRALREKFITIAVFLIFAAAAIIFFGGNGSTKPYSGPSVEINGVVIPVEIVRTDAERQRGLSGRESLDEERGMLFIFEEPARHTFWMKGMNFPIDIIWIENGRVADISENVPNDFDPANPKIYAPASPVRYVLEVNAGFAVKHGIKAGDAVILSIETSPSE